MNIYTRRGDDGSTSLGSGERVRKDDLKIELVGTLDEAQAFLGLARAECVDNSELAELLAGLERDLWILMAEAAASDRASRGATRSEMVVDEAMVAALETTIDRFLADGPPTGEFAVPGENRLSASLDVARTVVRRAERIAVAGALSRAVSRAYLNRLSDLCWVLARSTEGIHRTNHRESKPRS